MVEVRLAAFPVTTPVPAIIPAIVGDELDHVPPGAPSVSVVVALRQIVVGPAIGVNGFTSTEAVEVHPDGKIYEINVVPDVTPVITPEPEPTVTIEEFPEVHLPPEVASVAVVFVPMQMGMVDEMEIGLKG